MRKPAYSMSYPAADTAPSGQPTRNGEKLLERPLLGWLCVADVVRLRKCNGLLHLLVCSIDEIFLSIFLVLKLVMKIKAAFHLGSAWWA